MHQEFDPRDLEPSLPAREERSTRSKLAPIMIAVVALTGFGGVVWYAYDQGVRQAAPNGVTPLIKADTSPTKVRPDQPGGMDVPHQDKLVLNTLADGGKPGSPQVERLLPPPETPLPRPAPTAQPPIMTPAAPPQNTAGAPATGAGLPPKIGPTPPALTVPAPLAQTAAAPPPPAATPRDAVQTSGSSGAGAPTQIAAAPSAAPKPAAPPPAPKAVPAAAPTPTGAGFKVQLVSVKAQDQTKDEWARLQRTYPQLAPLKMSVTRVDLGEKGIWYRIYAGPLSDSGSAGELCNALKAKGQGCVVVKS